MSDLARSGLQSAHFVGGNRHGELANGGCLGQAASYVLTGAISRQVSTGLSSGAARGIRTAAPLITN